MSVSLRPIEYRLEIYENSFSDNMTAAFDAQTPFIAFNVGDIIDPHSMLMSPLDVPAGHWWKVKAIMHRLDESKPSTISHRVCLCVVSSSLAD